MAMTLPALEARRLARGVERYWLALGWGRLDAGTPRARWFLELSVLGVNVALLGPEAGR
jgi:hypothetical protein